MTINNRGLSGQPILPYVNYRSYQGADIFIDLAFLDYTGTPVTPSTLQYQIDDMTNSLSIVPATSVTVTGTAQTLRILGSVFQLSHNWQGSEVWQISMKAILPDGSTVMAVTILELLAIQTPNGSL
jgi:hypothetical protein